MSTRGKVKYPSDDPRTVICELCEVFYDKNWVSGTGGGISVRSGNSIFVAPSGVQKERMDPLDMFMLDETGKCVEEPENKSFKLSACTPLFMAAYRHRSAGAVIHNHSPHAVLSTLLVNGSEFRCTNLEMMKGIPGCSYFDTLVIPIIENTAREEDLSSSLETAILAYPSSPAVLVRRHGIYVWGRDWVEAKTVSECLDYLFELTNEMRKHGLNPEVA
eukprot:ANDGO_03799.mRNA.1 putative methylthioribulose-1-phosphate dehydratase